MKQEPEDNNLDITLNGQIDFTKSEAHDTGLFIAEGAGKMELTLTDGDKPVTTIIVHKLTFEGVVKQKDG